MTNKNDNDNNANITTATISLNDNCKDNNLVLITIVIMFIIFDSVNGSSPKERPREILRRSEIAREPPGRATLAGDGVRRRQPQGPRA